MAIHHQAEVLDDLERPGPPSAGREQNQAAIIRIAKIAEAVVRNAGQRTDSRNPLMAIVLTVRYG